MSMIRATTFERTSAPTMRLITRAATIQMAPAGIDPEAGRIQMIRPVQQSQTRLPRVEPVD